MLFLSHTHHHSLSPSNSLSLSWSPITISLFHVWKEGPSHTNTITHTQSMSFSNMNSKQSTTYRRLSLSHSTTPTLGRYLPISCINVIVGSYLLLSQFSLLFYLAFSPTHQVTYLLSPTHGTHLSHSLCSTFLGSIDNLSDICYEKWIWFKCHKGSIKIWQIWPFLQSRRQLGKNEKLWTQCHIQI